MINPELANCSLALIDGDKIIYTASGAGLAPLWECLEKFRDSGGRFTLFDKVVGLAAARLIVYSGIIESVLTPLASQPAKQFLEENGVRISADQVVANILRKDKSAICPGEIMAMGTDNRDDYLAGVKAMLALSGGSK
ncbi:MAG: hypothetical protein CVU71_04410 [Deltaproteobacteria bacterium HGW-Deltaproteobacteria-6]|jgi:NAD(P)H-flavin reductase|nr:MAG: hypothetical protein CVU71_04410 [Deltaproteobacteria bacterium HGW-Deltaproteobacteria-6]